MEQKSFIVGLLQSGCLLSWILVITECIGHITDPVWVEQWQGKGPGAASEVSDRMKAIF